MASQRAYGELEIRSVDEEQRIVEGVANSASVDSHGTIIEPAGAVYNLPIPFSMHHVQGQPVGKEPVGNVIRSWIVDGKRWAAVHIPLVPDDGTEGGREIKRRVDRAWAELKNGLVRGFSIEFAPIDPPSYKAKRWTKWRWLGLSGVSMPSNMDATIVAVRSAFESPGVSGTPVPKSPGVSGTNANTRRAPMTIQEQIQQHENSRAAKVARQTALMEAAGTAGETLGEAEAEEYDNLTREVESIDGHLSRLNTLKRSNAAAATAVAGQSMSAASQSRDGAPTQTTTVNGTGTQTRGGVPIVRVRPNTEPGIGFARYVGVLAAARGNTFEAARMAEQRWGDAASEIVETINRAAVAAGTTTDATWAAPLVQPTNLVNEFLELLRPATLLGKIAGLRRVPFNIAMPAMTGGGTYQWTGQGVAKPVSAAAFATVTLGFAKATGIIVLSKELVKFSSPSAETIIRDEMRDGTATFLDTQFTDPAIAAVTNVNPASITNGVAGTAASGTTAAAADADLTTLLGGFVAGNFGLGGVVLLMNEGIAFTLSRMKNVVGGRLFPDLAATGGVIDGMTVITSNVITAATGIIAVHAPSVLYADDGGVEIDASEQASVQMDSAPDNPTTSTTVMVSLWQRNLLGLRVDKFANWKVARSGAVRRIHTVAYVA